MTDAGLVDRARAYAGFFEALTEHTLADLDRYVAADVHFKDPFNDVRGVAAMTAVFAHMYRTCIEPGFRVLDVAVGDNAVLMHWQFEFRLRRFRPRLARRIEGVSRVCFSPDGRVTEHVDYWDAAEQVYEQLPVVGVILRWLRRRLTAR
ncbi:MAG: nuclear transport factor 2 family protein [Gammaproteobacteria bacterium]